MKPLFTDPMSEILSLTQAGRLPEATALIQRSLGLAGEADTSAPQGPEDTGVLLLDPPSPPSARKAPPRSPSRGKAKEGTFTRREYAGPAGRLGYMLYVPAKARGAMPLVVMLHGCTQSSEDFARGTRMNQLAEEQGFVVAYPEQTPAANAQKCWNWFRPGDQARDSGEPALIAGLTREIVAAHALDPARVYVAGLSAGGAAAAIMAAAYPDLYAAVGIHSGLACGSARDLPSALAAMQGNGLPAPDPSRARSQPYVPTITFHGGKDRTVHPSNSQAIHEAGSSNPKVAKLERAELEGTSEGGLRYRRVTLSDKKGRSWAEHWHVAGSGHAWSGGSPEGSYTDPAGPDASREMLRFFLQHSHPKA